MDCCQCQGIETKFDQKYVAKKLKKYRENGPKDTTRLLIDTLKAEEIEGMTLLDIGGGVGDIQHAMLSSGIAHVINNEASTAYLEACRQEAQRLGHADKIHDVPGNFVDVANNIDPADIVTLDRVICCYHDMPSIVEMSVQKAKKFYALVYPIDKWWTRLLTSVYYNFRNWLGRNPMRMFVHSPEMVESIVRSHGFKRHFYRVMGAWQIVIYSRS